MVMKRIAGVAVVLAALAASAANWPGFEHGIGMGGWLTNYKRLNVIQSDIQRRHVTIGDLEHFDTYITEADIARIKGWGFDHIRLGFDQLVLEEKPGVYRERTFKKIDDFIGWCGKHKLNVVLNLHKAIGNYCDIQEKAQLLDDADLQKRFIELWLEFERRYHFFPGLAFEILNEVRDVSPEKWNDLAQRTIDAIHAKNPKRWIVLGSVKWGSPTTLPLLKVFESPYVVYTFHMYEPFPFTHQRGVLQWGPHYYNRRIDYPDPESERLANASDPLGGKAKPIRFDRTYLENAMKPALEWAKEHPDKILWNGEYGTIRHAPPASRVAWMRDVTDICEEHGIPHCAWNYLSTPYDGNRFSLVDDDTREFLSKALLDACLGREFHSASAAVVSLAANCFAKEAILRSRLGGNAAFDRCMAEVVRLDKAAEYRWDDIESPDAAKSLQLSLRSRFKDTIGGFPDRVPLEPVVAGTVKRDGYRIEKLYFASRPNHHVTAHLFLPENPKFSAPYPAVVVPCGHSDNGKACRNYQRACVQGATAGFAMLIYDPIDQGERSQLPGADKECVAGHVHLGMRAHLLGWSTAQFRIWDGMRAIDYLETRPDIDASRIGMMGQSGGGTLCAYLTAMDTRIKASCPACYVCSMTTLTEDWGPQDCEQVLQGQLALGLNHLSLVLMAWPRPVRLTLSEEDFFPFRGALSTFASAKMFYNRFDMGDRMDFASAPGPHAWYESTRQASIEWMKRWLRGDADIMTKEALAKLDDGFSFDKVDCALADSEEANVTPGGKVMNLPGERSVYDFLRDELARIDMAGRPALTRDLVLRTTGIRLDAPMLPEEPTKYVRGTYWAKVHSPEDELAAMDIWLGTSFVARKAEQMIAKARVSGVRRKLVASGADCVAAAHAWYLAPELFDGIELNDRPPAWRAFLDDIRRDGLKMQMLVYGALRCYDWPDLLQTAQQ